MIPQPKLFAKTLSSLFFILERLSDIILPRVYVVLYVYFMKVKKGKIKKESELGLPVVFFLKINMASFFFQLSATIFFHPHHTACFSNCGGMIRRKKTFLLPHTPILPYFPNLFFTSYSHPSKKIHLLFLSCKLNSLRLILFLPP